MQGIGEQLLEKGIPVSFSEPMRLHTTLRLGGNADVFVQPENEAQLETALRLIHASGEKLTVIGHGSNLLVRDGGIRGVVLMPRLCTYAFEGDCLIAGAGCMLHTLSEAAAAKGLAGLAFASGIPGTLGGAVFMNAGAYGGEIGDLFVSAVAYTVLGERVTLTKEEMAFSYRKSGLQESGAVLSKVCLQLTPGKEEAIRAEMAELAIKRRDKQPLNFPSAGSTFKRPENAFAAQLIDHCGLRGTWVGGAQVSEKHAGFLLNRSGTSKDFLDLMALVEKTVYEKTGIRLESEVRILGEDE
ncbi:MAG: UDP-N-acetylmuramate dehydrogenase [Clostridia bacterium]|nr:UDP-N-acetylmuramate dehydrogenase [Clostridia bacterium]